MKTDSDVVLVESPGRVSFAEIHQHMLDLQAELGTAVNSDLQQRVLLFEPSPVVTLGSGAQGENSILEEAKLSQHGIDRCSVDRGGEATYHGPGQLLAYPVIQLQEHERDLHVLLRNLEEAILLTLGDWNIEGQRDRDHTGVWVGDSKIASVGLSVRRWVTGHGLALYVSGNQEPFQWIIPCGLKNCKITTMESLLGSSVEIPAVEARLKFHLLSLLNRTEVSS